MQILLAIILLLLSVPSGAAVFQVYGKNNVVADTKKDAEGSYKLGDVVAVLPDKAFDGNVEKNPIAPPWYMLLVDGITLEEAQKYMAPKYDDTKPITLFNGMVVHPVSVRRNHRIDLSTLPPEALKSLARTRVAKTDWKTIAKFVKDKKTGLSAASVAVGK